MSARVSVLIVLAAAAPADADAGRFDAVIEANPVREDIACSYTTTSTSSERPGETRTERFSVGNGWSLLAVDGDAPSAEALSDYAGGAEQRSNARRPPERFDIAAGVRKNTAAVVDEDAETLTFALVLDSDEAGDETRDETGDEGREGRERQLMREMMEQMRGTLVVSKPDYRLLRLVFELLKPSSIMPTVKIREFRQEFAFAVDPATGAALPSSMKMAMRGKAFVFKKLHREALVAFSDYDCQQAAPAPAAAMP